MDAQFMQTLMICIAVMLVLFLLISCFIALERQMLEIKSLLYDKHVHFDPKIDKLVDLAVDHWRLKKHIEKIKPQLSTEDAKRVDNSIRRMENYLHENDIEVNDYAGRSANDGINVEVVSVEQDPSIEKPIIKETIVPAVTYKGSLRKKSQVIILDNSQLKEQQNDNK